MIRMTPQPEWRHSLPEKLTFGFVAAALLLGGAGQAYPLLEMMIQWLALALLAQAMIAPGRPLWQGPLRALGWVALLLAVALLLQMMPLPPALWQALPGRDVAAQIDAAMGWSLWRPFSLTPDATGAALLALLPPLAGVAGGLLLRQPQRARLVLLIVALALGMALLGILQMASGGDGQLVLFKTKHDGFGVGLFVNRNHQACFLLMAMPLALALSRAFRGPLWRWAGVGALVVLALGVVATASRTGLFLLPLVACGLLLQRGVLAHRGRLLGAMAALAGAAALIWFSPAFQFTLGRFSTVAEDGRLNYWRNSLYLLQNLLPWGSGLGSFRQVYAASEPLAQVLHEFVEHAHNDYLEWLVEMGWPGALLLLGAVAAILAGFRQTLRRHGGDHARVAMAQAGLTGLLVLMACSLTDYPSRMPALAVLAGVLVALVMPAPQRVSVPRKGLAAGWAGGAALLLALPVGLIGGARQAVLLHDNALALRLAPWLAPAWSAYATQRLTAGDRAQAEALAERALRIEPMNAEAIRNLGLSRLAAGDEAGAGAILLPGVRLGWRDPVVMAWLADQGLAQGRYDLAAQGLDALLRIGAPAERPFALLEGMVAQPAGRAALVETLAERPGWRAGFLNKLAKDVPDSFPAVEALLLDLARAGAGADEYETAAMRWHAAVAGNFAQVARLWALAGGREPVGHPAFDVPGDALGPVAPPQAWRAPPLPGANVNLEQASHSRLANGVSISTDGIASGPVLAQMLTLPMGDYRATLKLMGEDGADTSHFSLALTCHDGTATRETSALPLTWKAAGEGLFIGSARFSVNSPCEAQDLALILSSSQGQHSAYSIKVLRVDTVAAGGASAK